MSFFKSLTSGLGSAAAGLVGSAVGSKVLGGGGVTKRQLREGHEADTQSYKDRDAYDWQMGQDRGLTPQEFYGSSAAGGSASSGGAQVLGNSKIQSEIAAQKVGSDITQQALNREVQIRGQDKQLEAAELSAGASLGSSKISADASRYSTDVKNKIAQGQLDLSNQEYNKISLPAAAANLKLTEQQTNKAINDVVTSTPEWQRSQKLLSMGVENTIQTALLQRFGVDITSKSAMAKLTDSQFRNILAVLVASGSLANREMQGLAASVSGMFNRVTGTQDEQFNLMPIGQNKGSKEPRKTLGSSRPQNRGRGQTYK